MTSDDTTREEEPEDEDLALLPEHEQRPGDSTPEDGGPETAAQPSTHAEEVEGDEDAEDEGPVWPVERAADLTPDHIPRKLQDQLERPLRNQLKALGQAYADAMDSRNDLLNGVSQQVKMANKESQRMNAVHVKQPLVQQALVSAGIVQEPDQAPKAQEANDA